MASEIPRRPLGRTGEQVSAVGFGGWHLGIKSVDEALHKIGFAPNRQPGERGAPLRHAA